MSKPGHHEFGVYRWLAQRLPARVAEYATGIWYAALTIATLALMDRVATGTFRYMAL
jgi:hypothetical protein